MEIDKFITINYVNHSGMLIMEIIVVMVFFMEIQKEDMDLHTHRV